MAEIWIFAFLFGANIHTTGLKMDLQTCKVMMVEQRAKNIRGVCIDSTNPSNRYYYNDLVVKQKSLT